VLYWDGVRGVPENYKKRKKIKTFMENLEGKLLTPDLIGTIINHRNKWLKNVFRHYIQ